MTKNEALFHYLLRLADDALILGHRLAERCSRGPFLEEDLALTNIALDLTGRAQLYFEAAARLENRGRTADALVYRRPERQFVNLLLCEQPDTDFAHTIARQLLFSVFDGFQLDDLRSSQLPELAEIAAKAQKETRYHIEHAAQWARRLGQGTDESRIRMQQALLALWPYTGELFEMDDLHLQLLEAGIAADLHTVRAAWQYRMQEILTAANLEMPDATPTQTGGRRGIHSEYLGHMLAEMQYLVRAYPDATW